MLGAQARTRSTAHRPPSLALNLRPRAPPATRVRAWTQSRMAGSAPIGNSAWRSLADNGMAAFGQAAELSGRPTLASAALEPNFPSDFQIGPKTFAWLPFQNAGSRVRNEAHRLAKCAGGARPIEPAKIHSNLRGLCPRRSSRLVQSRYVPPRSSGASISALLERATTVLALDGLHSDRAPSRPTMFDAALKIGLVALLVYACSRIILPLFDVLLWSAILAVMLYPLHLRLRSDSAIAGRRC